MSATARDLRNLRALVAASVKLGTAARLVEEAAPYITAAPDLCHPEVGEGVRNIAEDLHAYLRRVNDAIGKIP